jgi:hypothetical protein
MYTREKVYHSYFNDSLLLLLLLLMNINLDVVVNYLISLLLYIHIL